MSLHSYLDSKGCFAVYGEYCPITGAAAPALEFERLEYLRVRDERRAAEGALFVERIGVLLNNIQHGRSR